MQIKINYTKSLNFEACARDFTGIQIDEPQEFHGNNLGPSPIEYFLIGVGSCISGTYVFCLQKYGVKFKNLEVIVDGQLKHVGPKMNLKLVNINIELLISFEKGQPTEKIELCEKIYKEHCPISDIFVRGIPLNIKISKT